MRIQNKKLVFFIITSLIQVSVHSSELLNYNSDGLTAAFVNLRSQLDANRILSEKLRKHSFNEYEPCEDCYVISPNIPWKVNLKIKNNKGIIGKDFLFKKTEKNLPRAIINVCWISKVSSLADQSEKNKFNDRKKIVRLAAQQWEFSKKSGNLQFAGWGSCPPPKSLWGRKYDGISIKFTPNKTTSRLGNESKNFYPSMKIKEDTHSLFGVAVHEFGHALGLYHEQVSPQISAECIKEIVESDYLKHTVAADNILRKKAMLYSEKADMESVMNYCNKNWHNGKLSTKDIEGIQYLYPFKDFTFKSIRATDPFIDDIWGDH